MSDSTPYRTVQLLGSTSNYLGGESNFPPGFVARDKFHNRRTKEPSSVLSAGVLKRDWYGWCLPGDGNMSYLMLTLLEGEKWDAGPARLLLMRWSKEKKAHYYYGRGKYRVYLDHELDDLQIELVFSRFYFADELTSRQSWKASWKDDDGEYHHPDVMTANGAGAMQLRVPLEDRKIPDGRLTCYVDKLYFVDKNLKTREYKTYSEGGLFTNRTWRSYPHSFIGLPQHATMLLKADFPSGLSPDMAGVERKILTAVVNAKPPGFKTRGNLSVESKK